VWPWVVQIIGIVVAAAPCLASDLEELVVTGTRIPSADSAAAADVTVLGSDELNDFPSIPLGETLQQLPSNTGSPENSGFNSSGEQRGGTGATRIDLRGMGPERTLVLVNGRRMVTGPGVSDPSVDLGAIPLNLVDRVEVLGAGTSAVHGADGIGGVVNIITRRPDSGTELSAQTAQTDQGDGRAARLGIVSGRVFDRGTIQAGIEWYQQDAVWMRERSYSEQRELLDESGGPVPFGLAQTPQGYFRIPDGNTLGLPAGVYTRVQGSADPASAQDFRPFNEPADRYNPNEDEYLRTPVERTTLWLQGYGDLGESTTMSFEALLHRRKSRQSLRPAPIDVRFGIGIPRLANGRPGIPADNYYNPFGVNLLDVRRRLTEAGRRELDQDVTLGNIFIGVVRPVEGWDWEASASWSRNKVTEQTSGELRTDHLQLALGPSGLDDNGQPVCGSPDAATGVVPAASVIGGCVPLNLFSGQGVDGAGTVDAGQLGYVTGRFTDEGSIEQWTVNVMARGSAGRMPGGEVRWVTGVEYRHEQGQQHPDPAKAEGVTGSTSGILATNASYDVTEMYGELRMPLADGLRWANVLELDIGGRWSDFSSFGSTTNGAAQVFWRIAPALALRAGYAQVFRAPPLPALYAAEIGFYTNARDPCGNQPDPQQRINCAANGVPGGEYVQAPLDEIPNIRGGNARLKPEHGHTWSVGTTVSSESGQASLSINYWSIALEDAIRELADQTILDDCAASGAVPVCALISRTPDGDVARVDTRYRNIGGETASGVDADGRYSLNWRYGTTALRLLSTWLAERSIRTSADSTTLSLEGNKFERGIYPRWRAWAGIEHLNGPWLSSYGAQYIGPATECTAGPSLLPGLMTGCRQIRSVLYHDLAVRRRFGSKFWCTFAITNLTDVPPPRVAFGYAEGNTNTLTYRLLGRTIGLSLEYRIN
jgi:iron complex outermembrane recepter protein